MRREGSVRMTNRTPESDSGVGMLLDALRETGHAGGRLRTQPALVIHAPVCKGAKIKGKNVMKHLALHEYRWRLIEEPGHGALPLAAACAALVFTTNAAAQASEEPPLEEVIVIGTPGGAGIDRQEASFAITTIQPDEITRLAPQSTADLLKSIPGIWVESSSGIAGANIDVRGLPGGGDAPFVTMAINGSPLYGTEMLSFFEQSAIFRIDETVASVEGLRGGPNAVFGKASLASR